MSEKVETENRTGIEIAVIGMAGRFPGAKNIHEFWENLKMGIESISFLSDEEISESEEFLRMKSNPNYVNSNGGVLENIEYFDAYFFGYTPIEAEIMDPQIRIFLECSWEVLENAGYAPGYYAGLIGLYAGALNHFNWKALSIISTKSAQIGEFAATLLTDREFLPTTVSYKLGLKGPAVLVQTACSTSLVAIHMACQALLSGECDMALAGGISIDSLKKAGYIYQEGMVNSPDGRCRAFDSKANGFFGGSGVGIVMLKLLDDALEDRDHIFAVIKGSAINNDGNRKSSYTAPSVKGQSEAIITAHRVSEVPSESITYVETHGTGTKLGDPIEIEALKKGFNSDKKNFCAIGSVKTNIGHLNAAAGAAGFIKTVLALIHRLIPPSLNFDTPNPEIDFENSPFSVNKVLREWKSNGYPLRAGVSAFGIGGTNAHIVLEEAPGPGDSSGSRAFQLILLSAKTKSALDTMSKNLAEYLKNNPGINLADMAFTLNTGRSAFNYRRMIVCSDVNETIHALYTQRSELILNSENIPVVFVFSGLGSQYVNMGLDLYKTEVVFRNEMDRCFQIIASLSGNDIKDILYPSIDRNTRPSNQQLPMDGSKLSPDSFNRFEVAQLVVFIFEYALSRLLMEWGIKPRAMIGYSFGEYIAACIAGVFSLEEAIKLVIYRGKLIEQTNEGAMLSVPLTSEEVKSLIFDGVSIAIDNGLSCVVSGSIESIAKFEEKMKQKGQICIRIKASLAIHSAMMEPVLKEFANRVKEVKLNKPQIPYISNVTGTWMTEKDAKNPEYWKRHLRETVRFSDGINQLIKKENVIFVEIGPGRDISALLERNIENDPGKQVINLIRPSAQKVSDAFYLLNKIGIMWLWGLEIDWSKFYSREKRYRIPLPSYPFEPQRYWIDGDLFKLGTKMMKENPQSGLSTDMSDWLYLPSWKRFTHYPVSPKTKKNSVKYKWLVFVNELNPGKLIVNRLENEGHTVVVVKNGNVFERKDERTYIVNPGESGDYDTLFNELRETKVVPHKIIHCWGLTGTNHNYPVMKSFEEIQNHGFHSLLYIAKAIGKQDFVNPVEIKVLTDNLHEVVGGEPLNPAKSTVLGLINSIPQEYPEIQCINIDILLPKPGTSEEEALIDTLLEEFTNSHHEPVIAIRNNNRWVRIFEPLHLGPELKDQAKLRKNGVYLITGGLGKIGLMLSELLARRVGARLVLTGRSQFPPKDEFKIEKLQQIEALGAQVLYIQADAANPEQMREVILRTRQTFGMINGVIHCAGITKGRSMELIQNLSSEDCSLQFQPKAYGAAVLEELFENKELDFAWMLSSISGFLGGLGFAAYAAANIFMDTLVRRSNRLGKKRHHWLSLNWDGIEAEKSIEIFERLLSLEKVDQIIFSVGGNLQKRFDQWIKMEQVKKQVRTSDEKENKPKGHPRPYLTNKYVPPKNFEEKELTVIWERILGIDGIGANDNFLELGGDSLKAITLLSRIHRELGVNIPVTEFFNRPTIESSAEYISARAHLEKNTYMSIKPVEEKEYYELSSAQKRMYIVQQMRVDNTSYNLPYTMRLEGKVETIRLETTFKNLIERHESLRTSFVMMDVEPVQRIHKKMQFNIEYFDAGKNKHAGLSPREENIINSFMRPFDLAHAPFLRVGLIKLHETGSILMVDIHHIISDYISIEIIIRDFKLFYNGEHLPLLKLQYKDYSEWQNNIAKNQELERQKNYWLKIFEEKVPVFNIPGDYNEQERVNARAKSVNFNIRQPLLRNLKELSQNTETTIYMLMLAIFNILLSRYTGQKDIVVGSPYIGRNHNDLKNIVGMFVNMLALRNRPEGRKTIIEFLKEVKQNVLGAFENGDYQFDELVSSLGQERKLDKNSFSLFNIVLAMQDVLNTELDSDLPGNNHHFKIMPYESEVNNLPRFDLTIFVTELKDKIHILVKYSTGLFKEKTIKKLGEHYIEIIEQVTKNPEIKLEEIILSSGLLPGSHPLQEKDVDFDF